MDMTTAVYIGLGLGLRHALDADHVVAVTSMLSDGGRIRSAIGIGLWWGVGHGVSLMIVGSLVLLTGFSFPAGWQGAIEASVGAMVFVLGAGLLLRHARGAVHWHEHDHKGAVHAHFHHHRRAARAPKAGHERRDHEHEHRRPGRLRAVAVGAVHGLAGTGPLVILLALTLAGPAERYAALAASALGTVGGMLVVTACLAIPFAGSRTLQPVWYARLQITAGLVGVLYGLGIAVQALGIV